MGKLLDVKDRKIMFNEIWTPMLADIGFELQTKSLSLKKTFYNQTYLVKLNQISKHMWENRTLIDQYLEKNKNKIRPDHKAIIREWRDKAIYEEFYVIEHTSEGSVLIGSDGNYLAKGVNSTWEELTAHQPLPVSVTTVLLPWNECITTTGLVMMTPMGKSSPDFNSIRAEYQRIKAEGKIRTRL